MSDIKEYSTLFATKVAYVTTNILNKKNGVIAGVSSIASEKESTAKNWLFSGKVPREAKRIAISDSFGLSNEYLFDDDIPVKNIQKPKAIIKDGCYWIPLIPESDLFLFKNASVYQVKERIPVMLPSLDKLFSEYGSNIYATKTSSSFEPYIDTNSTLIYTDQINLGEYKFILVKTTSGLVIKRIILSDDEGFQLQSYKQNQEVLEPLNSQDEMLLILFSFSI